MRQHHRKTEDQFAWEEASKRVKQEASFITARWVDSVLADLNGEMLQALNEGRIIDIEISRDELKSRLWDTARRELKPGGRS